MIRQWVLLAAVLMLVFSTVGTSVQADESRPLYIALEERQPDLYQLRWRIPGSVPAHNLPAIQLPASCRQKGGSELTNGNPETTRYSGQILYHCVGGLADQLITIHYRKNNPAISNLFKIQFLNGQSGTALLSPDVMQWQVPATETRSSIARDYTWLGIYHIWVGLDHLLFLVCLIWIAGSLRRVLITVTGFTLAHSVTLGLSALQVIRVPVPPVEAVIALSIVFLASEIAKGGRNNLTWQYPIAVSSSFGLLHGLGFAAALNEIGLPQTEVISGLLFFNVGVEIGQVLFVAAIVFGLYLLKTLALRFAGSVSWDNQVRKIVGYGVGGIASFWLVERTVEFMS